MGDHLHGPGPGMAIDQGGGVEPFDVDVVIVVVAHDHCVAAEDLEDLTDDNALIPSVSDGG